MRVNTVVAGYDGSANAHDALETATDLVTENGAVHVVTAFEPMNPGETARVIEALPEEFRSTYDALATPRAHLEEADAYLAAKGVDHHTHLVEGNPAGAILDVADDVDADLIVVGSRGLGRTARFVRGSVSSRVANNARRSFLIVHDDER